MRPELTFRSIIHDIEQLIVSFYKLSTPIRVEDHIISSEQLSCLQKDIADLSKIQRASVLFSEDQDQFFLGLYFHDAIIKEITNSNPLKTLNFKNIDAFCVLVEEISHFFLIANRLLNANKTSELELELQGDIDKFLMTSLILEEQTGKNSLLQAAKLIFEKYQIISTNKEIYEQANKLAAKYCFDISLKYFDTKNFLKTTHFQLHCIQNYNLPLNEKKMYCNRQNKRLIAA